MHYRIYPLNTGYLFSGESDFCENEPGPNSSCHVPAIAFLVTNGVHHLLVDTGMPDTGETLKHRPYSDQPEGFYIVQRLGQQGLCPQQLKAIILSHLHWDHCAYMGYFPGVRKLVQKSEATFATDPPLDYRLSYRGAQTALKDPDLETIQGNFRYNSKISLIPTPGHSPGHQSVMVQTLAGPFILAGDAVWPDPEEGLSPPRKATDPIAAKNSFHGLLESAFPLLGSHDPSVLRAVVYG